MKTDIKLAFTDKEITDRGGIVLLQKMMEKMGFVDILERVPLPKPCFNRGYDPKQIIPKSSLELFGIIKSKKDKINFRLFWY